ncbi:hypothetical protein SeLEV6574_g06885 [Synchytrium endobioticum]|uniref:Uncharacterized protein n=1 Tax=Synchytrium endobioticum TaxID=286115 RepID=A0A507CJQ4_9FUNG|nr:hypothetical protein SeLEV6574_g06885 [Synchytrium endobioticum]
MARRREEIRQVLGTGPIRTVRVDVNDQSTGNTRNATPERELCENMRCTYQTDCASDSSSNICFRPVVICRHIHQLYSWYISR